jgi:hypothetical protein
MPTLSECITGDTISFDINDTTNTFTATLKPVIPGNNNKGIEIKYPTREAAGGSDTVSARKFLDVTLNKIRYVYAMEKLINKSLTTDIEGQIFYEWHLEEPVQSGGYRKSRKNRKSKKSRKSRKQRKTRRSR